MQTVFITAASGHIGSELIPLLLAQPDIHLLLPTRDASKLQSLYPSSERVTILEGSIQDAQWVETQLQTHSCTEIFLCLTGTDELMTTLNIFSAIKRSPSIKHIVYISACADFFPSGTAATGGWLCGHALVKLPIELALQGLEPERLTYTILGPSLFFENDIRQKMGILKAGVYPEGLGPKGGSRVDVRDIARAVEIALLDGGKKWGGRKVMLGSRKRYNEDDISRIWTKAMGKPIKCALIDDASLDKNLEVHFREVMGALWARDLRLMYEGIRDSGFGPSEEEYKTEVEFLGREPAVYEDFVTGLAQKWKQEA